MDIDGAAALLWILLLFTAATGLARGFVLESERGTDLALRLHGRATAIWCGKFAANACLLLGLAAFATPLLIGALGVDAGRANFLALACVLSVGCIGVAAVFTTTSALVAQASAKGALLPALTFPVLVPALFAGVRRRQSGAGRGVQADALAGGVGIHAAAGLLRGDRGRGEPPALRLCLERLISMGNILKAMVGAWMAAGLCYVFLKLPPAQGFNSPELARIVALHLPCAYVAVIAAFIAGWHAIQYLRKRSPVSDSRAQVAAALAALFCLLTTVTGSFFARVQWGSYWNWDPRQTSVFLLLLIYAAYFVLRASIEDHEKRASVSAVYMLFAVVMTPLLGYIIPRAMPQSLHPKMASFDTDYRLGIYVAILPAMLGLMLWLNGIAGRIEALRLTQEDLL